MKNIIYPTESGQSVDLLRERLSATVRRAKDLKLPTIILFEGWGASGKGYMIEKLIRELDPRGFKVYSIGAQNEEEARYPWLRRFWSKIPSNGNISIFDRSWYREVSICRVEDEISGRELSERFEEIKEFERQLHDGGYLIIKFFLHIDKDEQAKRFKKLESSKATAWRVTKDDHARHKKYDQYLEAFSEMIERTDKPDTPWHVLGAKDKKRTAAEVISITLQQLEVAIAKREAQAADAHYNRVWDGIDYETADLTHKSPILPETRTDKKIVPVPIVPLDEYDLSKKYPEQLYKQRLDGLQEELFLLHNKLYTKKRPLIIVFEGWDAAGKGGAIKRLTSGLDPRGYEVTPVSAPTPTELSYHYLWRFWNALPRTGHIEIFDRSWYGRVMVERLEGFAKTREWTIAFDEINHFEQTLYRSGAIIVKFWLHIDDDEQLRRFEERQSNLAKQWKITDEDWRNREKRIGYHIAVDQMLKLTNTSIAPWYVIEANDKKYARIKVLEKVIEIIKREL